MFLNNKSNNLLNGGKWYQTLIKDILICAIGFGLTAIFVPVTAVAFIGAGIGLAVTYIFDQYVFGGLT